MRQVFINCIPKGNKPRDLLKNWRPISLANVLYKMGSSVIAARLKCVLPNLISTSQTGFLQDRFIGESTRLIYDIMSYAESNNIDGLLILIDFKREKLPLIQYLGNLCITPYINLDSQKSL